MKIAAAGMLLGGLLACSAQAAESGVPAAPLLSKDLSVQAAPSSTKKNKTIQGGKAKSSVKAGASKAGPKAKQKQDSVTETPPESTDQSVQLKGVRG